MFAKIVLNLIQTNIHSCYKGEYRNWTVCNKKPIYQNILMLFVFMSRKWFELLHDCNTDSTMDDP